MYEFSLANWIVINIINYLDLKDELYGDASLLHGFQNGKLGKNVLSFLHRILKRNKDVLLHELEEKWKHFVVEFIFEGSNSKILNNNENMTLPFLDLFTQDMYLFYNAISIYYCILRANDKTIMFDYHQNNKNKFIYYLKLYSVFNDGIDMDFSGMCFVNYDFRDLNMKGINLSNCILDQCFFSNCNMSNANLNRASFRQTMLNNVNFSFADLSYTNLEDADCSDALLRNANLYSANLRNSNLRNCNMQEADCSYANFFCSNLEAAICEDVNFYSANLSSAYLGNTVLKNAYLKNSNLKGVFFNIQKN